MLGSGLQTQIGPVVISHVMSTPKDRLEPTGGRNMPIVRVTSERRVMDNGTVIYLIDFQAPEVNHINVYRNARGWLQIIL